MPDIEDNDTVTCAISGLASPANPHDDVDDLEDLPVGWARVTVAIRVDNPKHAAVQRAKEAMVLSQLAPVPEDQREQGRELAETITDATFALLDSRTPRYLIEEHEVSVGVGELPGLMETLGISAS